MQNRLGASILAALLLCVALSAAQCSPTDPTTGRVDCTLTGAGTFVFPAGVSAFTITQFSSGNGGDLQSNNPIKSNFGGWGAKLTAVTTEPPMIPIPDGFALRYLVGANGVTYISNSGQPFFPVGPPLSGVGRLAGTGGGPSYVYLPNGKIISLGAGGGAGPCGPGGAGGSGVVISSSLVGLNAGESVSATPGAASCPIIFAGGSGKGGGIFGQPGRGGHTPSVVPSSTPGRPGDADGTGGDATPTFYDGSGGGGGSITGAGGGGGPGGGGGGGGSYNDVTGYKIEWRQDSSAPGRLDRSAPVLAFFRPFVTETNRITSTSLMTTTLATVTSSVTTYLTSTAEVSTTTQDPLSILTVTRPTDITVTATARRKKLLDLRTTMFTLPPSTVTAVTTSLLPSSCTRYRAVYPASCCPASWQPLAPVSPMQMAKRTGSAIVSSSVSLDSPPLVTTTSLTLSVSATVTESAPTSTVVLTLYDPTVTLTDYSTMPAETSTSTAFSSVFTTVSVDLNTAVTRTVTVTVPGATRTLSTTTTATATACSTQTPYMVSTCQMDGSGVNPDFYRTAFTNLKRLKQRLGGQRITVDCGTAGSYYY